MLLAAESDPKGFGKGIAGVGRDDANPGSRGKAIRYNQR